MLRSVAARDHNLFLIRKDHELKPHHEFLLFPHTMNFVVHPHHDFLLFAHTMIFCCSPTPWFFVVCPHHDFLLFTHTMIFCCSPTPWIFVVCTHHEFLLFTRPMNFCCLPTPWILLFVVHSHHEFLLPPSSPTINVCCSPHHEFLLPPPPHPSPWSFVVPYVIFLCSLCCSLTHVHYWLADWLQKCSSLNVWSDDAQSGDRQQNVAYTIEAPPVIVWTDNKVIYFKRKLE